MTGNTTEAIKTSGERKKKVCDICVFLEKEDARPYDVEAGEIHSKKKWVQLRLLVFDSKIMLL